MSEEIKGSSRWQQWGNRNSRSSVIKITQPPLEIPVWAYCESRTCWPSGHMYTFCNPIFSSLCQFYHSIMLILKILRKMSLAHALVCIIQDLSPLEKPSFSQPTFSGYMYFLTCSLSSLQTPLHVSCSLLLEKFHKGNTSQLHLLLPFPGVPISVNLVSPSGAEILLYPPCVIVFHSYKLQPISFFC